MKKPNENNPAAIGALIVVLLGALVVIFRSFVPNTEVALIATPVPAAAPVSAPPAVSSPSIPGAETASRDPFFHSDIQQIAAAGDALTPAPDGSNAAVDASTGTEAGAGNSDVSADPFASSAAPPAASNNAALKNSAKPAAAKGLKPSAKSLPPDPAIAENAAAQAIHLTAILGGDTPRAILEGAAPNPAVVRVGDKIGLLQVVAIHAQEIVLSGKSGLWTIPLQSAAPAAPPANAPETDTTK